APPVASPAPITTQTLSLAIRALLRRHSVDGKESTQRRLSHGYLRLGTVTTAQLRRGEAFAIRPPSRRAKQEHPGIAERASRGKVLRQSDPGLEIDADRVVRSGSA